MKVSIRPAPFELAIIGAAVVIGATAPVCAQENTAPPLGMVEGVVSAATDASATVPATVTIHSAFDGSVVLTVDANTHFRKAGGEQEPPVPLPGGAAPQAASTPSLTDCLGLFARAMYDPNSHVALYLYFTQPEPERFSGVVDTASATDLVLNVEGRGKLDLTLDAQTALWYDGLPTTGDKLAQGDPANVLFWPTASENDALRVDARMPPPLQFEGVLTGTTTGTGGAVVGFTAARGSATMSFQDSSSTQFWLDGKTATVADLKNGDFLRVSYQSSGGVNDALTVWAYTPRPVPTRRGPFEHHGSSNSNSGTTGSGTPGTPGSPNPNSESGQGTPKPVRPRVVNGLVGSFDMTGNTFTLNHEGATLTFSVDPKTTTFQLNDKPATFADLKQNQHVSVVYQGTTTGNLALKVLIHQPEVEPAPSGTGTQS